MRCGGKKSTEYGGISQQNQCQQRCFSNGPDFVLLINDDDDDDDGCVVSPLRFQAPPRLCRSPAMVRGLTGQVSWKIMPLAHGTQEKAGFIPGPSPPRLLSNS